MEHGLAYDISCKLVNNEQQCVLQCTLRRCIPNRVTNMPPEFDFAPRTGNTCSQSSCKTYLPAGYGYKTCEKCRSISRLSKRKHMQGDKGQPQRQRTASSNTNVNEMGNIEIIYVLSESESSDECNVSITA